MMNRSLAVPALVALALAVALPGQAGTVDAPEITDPAGDQALLGQAAGIDAVGFAGSDIQKGWVEGETGTEVHLFMLTSGTYVDGTGGPYNYEFHITVAGIEFIATIKSGTTPTAGGVATAVAVSGGTADLTVPKANIGAPAAGAAMTSLFIAAYGGGPTQVPGGAIRDRAPDSGFGTDYTFTGGATAAGNSTAKGNATAMGNSATPEGNATLQPQGNSTASASANQDSAPSNKTATASGSAGKKTPGLSLPLLAVTVGAVAWGGRRRARRV